MPPGYDTTFAGQFEMMHESQVEMGEAMVTAIVLVILTLAPIMESFRQPVSILVAIPLGLVGVMYALYIVGLSLDMFVLMGMIMLTGIVVNNAILIMNQFNVHVAERVPRHKAMIAAEMRNGVGVASVGGILVSGVLTLVVAPILYDLCTRKG